MGQSAWTPVPPDQAGWTPVSSVDNRSLFQKAKDNFNANTQGAKPGDGAVKGALENFGAGAGDVVRAIAHLPTTVSATMSQGYDDLTHGIDPAGAQMVRMAQSLHDQPMRTLGQLGTSAILGEGAGRAVAPVIRGASAAVDAATDAANAVKAKAASVTVGPQSAVMPSAAKLPLLAQSGLEDIFRAAAPTGKNIGFRENLNVAAPDLADIAHKIDISEAKGGIINPDMRVRATVDAIRSHLDDMYQNERAPQIQRNAERPVKVGTDPNSVRGLEYLETTAGDVADSALAKKALDGGTLTVAEADRLAIVANQTLRSFERMTPEGKMQIQTTSPKVGGLKALDTDLSGNLNAVLKANGENGLYSYERRYAGLSSVLDQLQTRMNATELKQEGVFGTVGRFTRPVMKVVKEGPSGVPSASQAATADVNIGRSLQRGMKKLKSSGITASANQ